MHRRTAWRLLVLFIVLASTPVSAACIDPAQLAHSTVSIMRYWDDTERDAHPNVVGIRGTGWFLSPATIVTAEHVTGAMKLSTEDWRPLEIRDEDGAQFIGARIQRLAGGAGERLAVIELQRPVSTARSFAIRTKPLVPEEQVMTFAYPAGRPHLVEGRFVRLGDGGKLDSMALLEIYEGENRFVIDHGASGAPVVDCDGRVAAVISHVFTQTLVWASRQIRISTAWGMPNVASVPAQALDEAALAAPALVPQQGKADD
ncbi:serine protease [Bradyrhizobium sp. UFLA05-109]